MNLKKITSLVMLLSMILMTYTGIILFIAPQGKIAYWSNWEILALTKTQYGELHSTFMVLFIIATLLHIYYNFRLIVNYLSNKAKEVVVFTKEMVVATLLTVVFIVGTLYEVVPFSSFLSLGDSAKEYWEQRYGKPPYSRAENSQLKTFIKKTGLNEKDALEQLKKNEIVYNSLDDKLIDIAKKNHLSPNRVYEIMMNLK